MEPDIHIVGTTTAISDCEHVDVEWMRRADARRICGIGKDILDSWVLSGKVEAHKLNPGKNGTVIFSARNIRRAISESPRYVPGNSECAV